MTTPFDTVKISTPGDREIVITRRFNAPRDLVFEAMSQAEFLRRWLLGPPGWTMTECENDLRVGGSFRHVWKNTDDMAMAMHGVYREVVAPERIVRTEVFEFGCNAQAGEQLATLTLADEGQQTWLTATVVYPSKEARDATIASGMERGVSASYNHLDDVLAEQTTKGSL